MTAMRKTLQFALLTAVMLVFAACSFGSNGEWYRGNMHTHSLWSDGDAAPEAVVAWYKANGYDT